jgi:predicted secreted protein
MSTRMPIDWVLRVGDGENFISSSKYGIWGIQTLTSPHGKNFIKNVKPGDRLWFVKSKSQGKLLAVATYKAHNRRELGPLINISLTNEELGWTGSGPDWTSDVEVHYTDLYGLNNCELLTHIKGPSTIRKYDEKCKVNLAVEYSYIVRYSKVTFEL